MEGYFEKFLDQIEKVTKEDVKNAFLELRDSVKLSDEMLFNKILGFLEKKINEEGSLPMDERDTKLISLKIKIFKKNPITERYKLIYGYLTTLAAETLGNFYLQTDRPMDYIGVELEKGNLTAKKGGNFVGLNMSGGSIHILGNTGVFAGQRMSGGSIRIDGSAGSCLGEGIRGGKIYAKIADETANKRENVIVERYKNSRLQKTKKALSDDDIERYVEEALKSIDEQKINVIGEEYKNISSIDNNVKEISKEVSKKAGRGEGKEAGREVSKRAGKEAGRKEGKEEGGKISKEIKKIREQKSLTKIMQEVYGKVDIKKIEGIDYVPENERNIQDEGFAQIFTPTQEREEYKDENFERLKSLFRYKDPNKDEILAMNLDIDEIEKILNNINPFTLSEKMIIGYLTSIAAEKLAIRGEALVVNRNFDYIGMKMRNGRILVKNAGNYLGKNMYDGEIKVEGNATGNVGEGMIGGRIEIAGDVYGDYVGWRMQGGEILIRGSCRNFVGLKMKGGRIVVEKSAGNGIGERMEGGEILIKGMCGVVGKGMKKGIIRIKEGIISKEREGGEIYTL